MPTTRAFTFRHQRPITTGLPAFALAFGMLGGVAHGQTGLRLPGPPPAPAIAYPSQDAGQERSNPLASLSRPAAGQPEGDTTPALTLQRVSIDGATALAPDALAAAYGRYIGTNVSQADLAAIAAAISDAYRKAGYHLSRAVVPPQDIRQGHLRIQVIEGFIAEMVVTGDDNDAFGLRALLAPIERERPSRLSTLERSLLLANDRPGIRVKDTVLTEIGQATGRFRLTVSAQTWRSFAGAGLDNMGSRAVGPWQASASAALNSLVVAGDTLAIAGSFVPGSPHELRSGRISYDAPLGLDSLRLGVSASRSEIRVGDHRRYDRTLSLSDSYELRGAYAPILTKAHFLWLTAAIGISDVNEKDIYGRILRDRFRFASLTADYKLNIRDGSWTYVSATWRQGLGLINPNFDSANWLSRSGASGHFSLVHGSITHFENIAENWSIKLAASGQTSTGPLFTSQQFALGGLSFGRGFESGWLSGDKGIAGSAELRFDQTLATNWAKGYQLFGFVEGGAVRSYALQKDSVQSLVSAGLGARLFINDDVQLSLGVAKPLAARTTGRWDKGAVMLLSISTALRR